MGRSQRILLLAREKYDASNQCDKSISHKFLISENTQNEGDTIHSIIEMSMKKAKKSGSIYVPDSFNNQEL